MFSIERSPELGLLHAFHLCVCVWGGGGGLGARHCSPVEHIKDEMR